MKHPTVVFCGGGSGGHLAPAIAIIQQLRELQPDVQCVVFCSERAVDRRMLETASSQLPGLLWHPVVRIPRGAFPKRLIVGLLEFFRSRRQLLSWFRQLQPAVVVGLGAFASVPGILAARRLGIPTVLLEANTIPGRATRGVATRGDCLFTGLPLSEVWPHKLRTEVIPCGVPVRSEVAAIAQRPLSPSADRRTLLVIGGSQGSARLNMLVQEALRGGSPLPADWTILHQAGSSDVEKLSAFYRSAHLPAEVVDFLPNLPQILSETGLCVSRAGAVTLAELACAAIPAILVPLSTAADGHQQHNADFMAATGAAAVVDETTSTTVAAARLRTLLQELSHSPTRRREMASAARSTARPDAAFVIANHIQRIVSASAVATPRGTSSCAGDLAHSSGTE
jgi:UDP-N-acetylglucosamine--N-acetylmuramyl-(pentapeptide) pyrophosphoryl-undecaprenol N-acetylglucosamine transferase